MVKTKHWSGLLMASVVLCAGTARAAVVLDDQFASWHYSGTNTANFYTSTDASSLTWKSGTASSLISVTFPKQTLAIGESLSTQFTFSATSINSAPSGFRVALFDSNNKPITDNGNSIANDMYRGYTGYAAMTDLGSAGNGAQLNYRAAGTPSDSSNNLLGSGYPKPLGTAGLNANVTTGATATGTFTITRTASGLKLDFVLGGTNLSYTDTTYNYTSFDSLVFQVVTAQAERIVFTDVTVAKNVVPEPGTAATSLGLLGGTCLLAGRNLTRRK